MENGKKDDEKKGSGERDSEKEVMAVMQSVEGATIDNGFVGIGRREVGNHHQIVVNLHSD
jgi:hypothetical protein